jgi:hypothetical protein
MDSVNYSKPVLFKATDYAKFTAANKASFVLWLGWVFYSGARGES